MAHSRKVGILKGRIMMVKRSGFKLTQVPVLIAIISLISILSSTAPATEVSFAPEDIGGGQWVYHYMLTNDTLNDPIEQFVIWFEPGLYENLSIVSDPHIGYDWYQDTVEPDPVWLYYGAYRALAWDEGISVGDSESGFAVRFTYLGEGAPGVQEFDIVDPNEYISLEAGWTGPVYWVDAEAEGNPEQIGTPDKPFATIQGAIDTAVDGYTVRVLPGLYEENINFLGKAITVKSYGATMDNPAIISGANVITVRFVSGETQEAVIDGFLITNSLGNYGVYCSGNSSPTICNNLIVGCGTEDYGDGVHVGNGCHPNILFNTITGNGLGSSDSSGVFIDGVSGFSGLISHCIIYHNQNHDLRFYNPELMAAGSIEYCDIGEVNYDWLGGAEVDEYGNFSEAPRFVRAASGPGLYDGDYHLKNESACIDAGDPNYVEWEGQTDWDGQGRIIMGMVDIGIDEATPNIAVTKPAGGEVWAAESSHEIRWESLGIGDVDIYYSINNGDDWEIIDAAVNNTGSYEWQLPMVDSDECVVWVAASDEPEYIDYTYSGVFMIHPSPPGPAVESIWSTLGKDSARAGLSEEMGPEIGCVKWRFETVGPVYTSAAVGADDRVHIACEDGKIYAVDPNTGSQIWVFDANSPMTSSPTVGGDGTVYVGCMNGKLYAIDKDGNLRWTYDTGEFIYSTPAVGADGKVFFGSQDGVLYALGADGSELWEFATGGPGQVGGAILASPTIGLDGSVYIAGAFDPNLYALDPNDGTIRWVADFGYLADPEPAYYDDEVFVNGFDDVSVGLPLASPAVGPDGTIYILLPNPINLYALNPVDGSIIWEAEEVIFQSRYLEGRWNFEGDTSDSSGNGRDGVLQGVCNEPGCYVSDPERGTVLNLGGGQIDIHGYKGVLGTRARSVSAWINNFGGTIISWGDCDVPGGCWRLRVAPSGQLTLIIGGGVSITADNTYVDDVIWHHVAAVWENNPGDNARDIKLYIDGYEGFIWPVPPPVEINTISDANVVIGPFGGVIDDVRIYSKALSIEEIMARDVEEYCWQRPVIGPDGTIYVSYDDKYLRAFNPDGSVKWVKRVGMAGGLTLSVGSDGLIYAGSEDGSLYVISAEGEEVSRFDGQDWVSWPAIMGDGQIVVSDANNVWAIEIDGCSGQSADLHRPGDVNADWIVDIGDLVLLGSEWLGHDEENLYLTADVNRDLFVNLVDAALLAKRWLIEEHLEF
jgi:outer membrane protein assembly factor BamB